MNDWYNIDNTNIPYNKIDKELVVLIKLLNNISGIKTTSCCCGHGKEPCSICIAIKDLSIINKFCFNYLNPFYGWHFEIENNINKDQDYLIMHLKSLHTDYNTVCNEINKLINKIKEDYND